MTITVKVVADSVSVVDFRSRITSFELTYPRIIHSEFMTHRLFSRNAASSRAIPVYTMCDLIEADVAMPVRFGANQSGMQDKGAEYDVPVMFNGGQFSSQELWKFAAMVNIEIAKAYSDAGYHKQICNRILEPYQHIKLIVTATEFDNFFHLRTAEDADPTIQALALAMYEAYKNSEPKVLGEGEWHTPYYGDGYWTSDCEDAGEEALAISASCCAQTSYRKNDSSLEKAKLVMDRMIDTERVHASPFEHQATPIVSEDLYSCGVTHEDYKGNIWSGNFKGWIQHRQLIPNNVCNDFKGV